MYYNDNKLISSFSHIADRYGCLLNIENTILDIADVNIR